MVAFISSFQDYTLLSSALYFSSNREGCFSATPCFTQPNRIQIGDKHPHTIVHLLGHSLEGLGQLQSEEETWISLLSLGELWSPCCYGSAFKILFLCTCMKLQCRYLEKYEIVPSLSHNKIHPNSKMLRIQYFIE